jgi:glyoxylase-like metal-dependent hydrolase (beta-lactamase superfamily II)
MSTGQVSASGSLRRQARPGRRIATKIVRLVGMTTYTTIDLNWTGRPQSIAAALIESDGELALIDPGPESTLETLRSLLRGRGHEIKSLQRLLLTHIHLDHAGATGSLVRENPNLKVYVHEFGALHMVDPSRLLASAGRLYGGDLKPLYGECLPVPQQNIVPQDGGERLRIGNTELEVFYTPGHASHHVTFWDSSSRIAFVGDTAGIRVAGHNFLLPATPPPDIDLALWNASLDQIASWNPERLFLTHFGFIENPAEHIRLYKKRLREWMDLTRSLLNSAVESTEAENLFVEAVSSEIKAAMSVSDAEHYIFNGGLRLSWLGLLRYARKNPTR